MALGRFFSGFFGLGRCGAHEFDAHERENGDLEAGYEAHELVGEEASMAPKVGEGGRSGIADWKPLKIMNKPTTINAAIATILMRANQNSVSPKAFTVARFRSRRMADG
jgi:hypothetical protein